MSINLDQVRHIAKLANLEFDAEEQARIARQLGAILDYVAQLERLDTSQVEPTSHVGANAPSLRDDVVRPPLERDVALANAPDADRGLVKVPRVIG